MVSIIVPVYQVENYLHKCVDSILTQSYPKLQVILVDDGSRDGSSAICDGYAAKDPRVQVIHKENGGLSDARNAGLAAAEGDFVMFVDADDYIHPDMVALLRAGLLNHNARIAGCGIDHFSDAPRLQTPGGRFREVDVWQQMARCPEFSVCNRLFRRELFETLRFPVGRIFEDQFVIFKLLAAGKVVATEDRLYFYFQRLDGLSKQRVYPETYDLLDASLELLRDIPKNQRVCRRAFSKMAVSRIGLVLGNGFYQDGQYRNCKPETTAGWVAEHLPELVSDAPAFSRWMLRQVARGQGSVFRLLAKSYLKPGKAAIHKLKRVLKIG